MGMPVITSSNISRKQAISDIITSVALEQTALSHILNAEGEKIQKVISLKEVSTAQLLEVNKSVESMVKSISKLEMVLQSKLELFSDCICQQHECGHHECSDHGFPDCECTDCE